MANRMEPNHNVMLNLHLLSADTHRFRVATTFIPVHRAGFSGVVLIKSLLPINPLKWLIIYGSLRGADHFSPSSCYLLHIVIKLKLGIPVGH